MKYLIYPIIICLIMLVNVSTATANTPEIDLKHYKKIDLPYTSNDITKYYYWEDEASGLHISPNPKMPFRFSTKELSYQPKLARFFVNCPLYFPTIYFHYKNITYKGVIFMIFADNDEPIFYFQLNSYDRKGNFIDAIILDERFSAEGEALVWSDFKIQTNGQIIVNQMEQILIDDDMKFKNGDIYFLKKNIYKMSSTGVFKKIKETTINDDRHN
ncbi:hypothetical protein ACQP6C_08690 [Snodgrassella alvi]|uniref:hypothetical protein n=1 Tax=Snodgrassella alvi TaxID=1196083 RepID=UPI003D045A35